ncbi:MAG TPA: LysR family transcriptional regulator [Caulobacteraceae bacterium]|nr:LysR family transcriptional regulator [Caulobacteraceae bacterium]
MTLEQLRIFVAVAERQHITQASAALHLTQSAVSSAISALENRHDVRLFDRVGRNIVLNQTGEVFLQEARSVLARAEAAEAALADLGGMRRGRLSVHASQTIASYWLPERLVAFHNLHPAIEVEVAIGNTAEVARAVKEGFCELGLVEGEVDDPVLSKREIGSDQMVIVVGRGHPWVDGRDLTADALTQTPWVFREAGSGTRSAFAAALDALGVDPAALRVVLTLPANEAVLTAVEAGAGATALSLSVASPRLRGGHLHQVPFDLPSRPYFVLRHKERYRSKVGDAFLNLARQSPEPRAEAS